MPKRNRQPTALADIMEPTDGGIIKVQCDAIRGEDELRCPNMVDWPARSKGLLDTMHGDGIPIHCDECVERMDREADARVARQQNERFLGLLRNRSGIPAKWEHVKLADLDYDGPREAAITAAGAWAEGTRRRGLLFHGPVGRGKTAIAAGAANGRISRGLPVRWLPVGELLMDLRMPFESSEYLRAQRALDPRGAALVLDDLDKVRPTEFAREPIYVAVNAWVEAELPLIVTMNRSLDELAEDFGERYGEAIASRLGGYCEVFTVKGEDRRIET